MGVGVLVRVMKPEVTIKVRIHIGGRKQKIV